MLAGGFSNTTQSKGMQMADFLTMRLPNLSKWGLITAQQQVVAGMMYKLSFKKMSTRATFWIFQDLTAQKPFIQKLQLRTPIGLQDKNKRLYQYTQIIIQINDKHVLTYINGLL